MRKVFLALLLPMMLAAQVVSYVSSPSIAVTDTRLNGLQSFWKFDGNGNDSKGSVNLDAYGGAYFSATGKSGQALSCEKDSVQYAGINSNSSLTFLNTQSFTVAAWVKTESAVNGYIVDHNYYYMYGLFHQSDRKAIFRYANVKVESTASVTADTWTFVCGWYDAATDSIYIKVGSAAPVVAAATADQTTGASNHFIGSRLDKNTGQLYDGLIDDVGIWNRCGRTFADSLYNSGNGWRP